MNPPLARHAAALQQLAALKTQEITLMANLETAMASARTACDNLTGQPGWAAANVTTPHQMVDVLSNLEVQVNQQLTMLEQQYAGLVAQLQTATSNHGPDADEEASQ